MLTHGATQTTVPFLDLGLSHEPLKDLLLGAFSDLIDNNAFTNGPAVAEFEAAFAAYCRRGACIGVASGLDALRLGLLAAGLEPGDEVIVPANTFIATLEAVSQAGGVPVIVDVTESDLNMDPEAARAAITERTRFLLPVHLYGQMADMRALLELGIPILEDACQAHGARRDGAFAGELGLAAAFSFYPGKNLGAFGDAGALVCDDEELVRRVKALREHGQRAKYDHELVGFTSRLDTIQAIVLGLKLPLLDRWNEERRAAARFYSEALDGVGDLELPPVAPGSEPVWHLYVVRTADPTELADHLRARSIGTGFHYPEPVHLSQAYRNLGYRAGSFPASEEAASRVLSLPIFPGISQAQLEAVVQGVRSYF
jgi:dTDP-4-amino-4,6-dideoxygalactose transaminase